MKFKLFGKHVNGIRSENAFQRNLLMVLGFCLIISVYFNSTRSQTIILVPPSLNEIAHVSKNQADSEYKKAWALFVAELMGNIKPAQTDFILKNVEVLLSPQVLQVVRDTIAQNLELIKVKGYALSFHPEQVIYEEETQKIFVVGQSKTTSKMTTTKRTFNQKLTNEDEIQDVTVKAPNQKVFEFEITTKLFKPIITYFNVYQGRPKTVDVVNIEKAKEKAKQQRTEQTAS